MIRKAVCAATAAAALVAVPSVAVAHHGQPFKNCTEAYQAGYSNITEESEHYRPALDRDEDGVGCDQPPAGFVPAEDRQEGRPGSAAPGVSTERTAKAEGTALAETGGNSVTPWIAGGGIAVLLAGGALVVMNRRRHATDRVND